MFGNCGIVPSQKDTTKPIPSPAITNSHVTLPHVTLTFPLQALHPQKELFHYRAPSLHYLFLDHLSHLFHLSNPIFLLIASTQPMPSNIRKHLCLYPSHYTFFLTPFSSYFINHITFLYPCFHPVTTLDFHASHIPQASTVYLACGVCHTRYDEKSIRNKTILRYINRVQISLGRLCEIKL